MNIKIYLMETSKYIEIVEVVNTYTKGNMYCVYKDNTVSKYPMCNIFKVVEDYV